MLTFRALALRRGECIYIYNIVKYFSVDLQRVLDDSSEAVGESINKEMNRWNQIIVPVFYFQQICFVGLTFHSHSSGKGYTSEFRIRISVSLTSGNERSTPRNGSVRS